MSALKKLGWETILFAVLFLFILAMIAPSVLKGARGATPVRSELRVIEYKNDGSKHDTVKVVYNHRHIMNLDRNVTELQTKLGSAGWVPVNDGFAKADVVPGGCIIRVLVSEREADAVQAKYALEGCDPGMSLASILFSSRAAGYSLGTYGYSGYRLITQNRRQ